MHGGRGCRGVKEVGGDGGMECGIFVRVCNVNEESLMHMIACVGFFFFSPFIFFFSFFFLKSALNAGL